MKSRDFDYSGMNTLAFLCQEAPGFALRGHQVKIIREPSHFYAEICSRASSASKRVTLSALYLGTGAKEKNLVRSIKQTMDSRPDVKVKVLLDYCRGTRKSATGESSCSLLGELLKSEKNTSTPSCRVALYHTPFLRGIWKLLMPPRYNETLGLQHSKVFVFDDSVILSGANLSHDYFTNRQDRYVVVENCPLLADYFDGLVDNISDFSFQMNGKGEFSLNKNWKTHPYKDPYTDFVTEVRRKMTKFLVAKHRENRLEFSNDKFISTSGADPKADTWIFPSIQMGLFSLDQDHKITRQLLESAGGDSEAKITFGTGYFNPTQDYLKVVLQDTKSQFDFIMAHPKANGFYKTKFPSGGIPPAYTLISKKFFELIEENRDLHRIRLFEYQKEGWTFHAKGLWYFPPKSSFPVATMIGSPNFGYRSVERDLEAQITIVTKDLALQRALADEQRGLMEKCTSVTKETFEEPDRRVPNWVKIVVAVARNLF